MNESVLILGANGRFGRVAVRAFSAAGWNVIAQARRPLVDSHGGQVSYLGIPVNEQEAVVAAAKGTSVVVNAMNPLYTRWNAEALPLNAAAIAIARALGATLMLPGNVYNYGSPIPSEISEETPQRPTNRKGEIRCAMETAMRAGAPRSIVVRAGDFFGGPGEGSWMDQAVVKNLGNGEITYPGPRNLEHAWAFLPDVAQTFVLLAQARGGLAPHESFHFPGHTLTGDALVAAITRATRRGGLLPATTAPVVKGIPWTLLRIAGIFNPMLRELARMSYLWHQAHRLCGDKLERVIGTIPHTPIDAALTRTLEDLKLSEKQQVEAMAG
ncbi:MAG: sugar nucleotide-binding protein [Proteobacteria bacterium]|nr:sugar nucleotide-binding protein [Pseudomonadota bacterium]